MKTTIKRTTAMLLALVLCLSALMGLGIPTAHAAEQRAEVRNIQFPREGDDNYDAAWGHPALKYRNGWETKASSKNIIRAMESYSGPVCYCIEPGVIQNTGDTFVSCGDEFWDTIPDDLNHTLTGDEIRIVIGRILQYGYTGKVSTSWYSQNETDANKLANLLATQLLVWETIVGERDMSFNHVAPGDGYDCVAEYIAEDHPFHDRVFSYYNSIVSKVKKHTTIPSFCGKEYSLAWDGERYSVTLTDTNGVLDQFAFSAGNEAVKTSRSSNTLTVYTDTAPDKAVTITATRLNSFRKGLVVWTDGTFNPDGGTQDMVSFAESVSDPVSGSFTVKLGTGTMKLYKTSEDDNIAGITFTITGNGQSYTVTTDEKGEITLKDLTPGTYTVTEQSHDLYEPQESKSVTIVSGETATVNFNNTLRRGSLKVTKTSDDGLVEGIKFRLTGTAACGLGVEEYAVTDSTGKAWFENIPIGSGYVLAEVDTPSRYEVPDTLDVTIEWNTVTKKSVHNTLKLARIRISKTGEVFASVHCDSGIYVPIYSEQALAGAVFEIAAAEDITTADGTVRHAVGEVVDTVTTDESGNAVSKELYPGKYTVLEIHAPSGTVLNTEPKTVELSENADDEITEALVSFTNSRQKVAVTVKKQLEQNKDFGIGMGGEITSVTFGLYAAEELTAADGSVIPADGLMDLLAIGQDGKATCNADLPLGSYFLLELYTDEHYLLSQDKYPFTFAYAGQETPLVELTVNEGQPITTDGKRVTLYGKTREELYQKVQDAQKQIEEMKYRRATPTVADYCEKWLLMQSVHIRTTTLNDYRSKVKNHIVKPLGHMHMADVTTDDIRLALVPVSKKSSSMYQSVLTLYKSIFNAAVDSNIIEKSPCERISAKGGKPQQDKEALTDDQAEKLLDAIQGLPPYVFVMIGLYAGLRREEILALKWDCVFLDAKTPYLSVRRAWHIEHNRPIITNELKTAAARRDIPLPPKLCQCLKDAKAVSTSEYVIANRDGDPLSGTQFKRVWQYILTRTAKERTYTRYENGEKIVHTVNPVLGEKAAHNGKVIYSLDFHVTPTSSGIPTSPI